MPGREGSYWIEGNEICYIDERGEKKCQDFAVISEEIEELRDGLERNEEDVSDIIDESDFFEVTIQDTNSPADTTGSLSVTVRVENTGERSGTQLIRANLTNLDETKTRTISLDSGETTTLNFSFELDITLSDTETVTVQSGNTQDSVDVDLIIPADFDITIKDTNSPVTTSGNLQIDVDIANVGGAQDIQDISLEIDGEVRESKSLTLSPNGTASLTLTWEEVEVGVYQAIVSSETDSKSTEIKVTISGEAFFDVSISSTNEPNAGEDLNVDVEIENLGDVDGTQDISLFVDSSREDVQNETVTASSTKTITLTWSNSDNGTFIIEVASEDNSDTIEITIDVENDSFFEVSINSVNGPITRGQEVIADVGVENVGDTEDTQSIKLRFDFGAGITTIDSETIELPPGETQTVTLSFDLPEDSTGQQTITVESDDSSDTFSFSVGDLVDESGDAGVIIHNSPGETLEGVEVSASAWVEVFGEEVHFSQSASAKSANFDVSIETTNSPVTEGDTLQVQVTITNKAEVQGTQTITLEIDNNVGQVDSSSVTLPGGNNAFLILQWSTSSGDAGSYTATVSSDDDSQSIGVEVQS